MPVARNVWLPILVADAGGGRCKPADHRVGVGLGQRRRGQHSPCPPRSMVRNSGPFGSRRRVAAVEIGVEIDLQRMVAGHFVALATLFAKADPEPPVLDVKTSSTFIPRAAPTRGAKLNTISPIKRPVAPARPAWRISIRIQELGGPLSGQVLTVFPGRNAMEIAQRTEAAGFSGTTWPITSQSKTWRIAARCCLAVGADRARLSASM